MRLFLRIAAAGLVLLAGSSQAVVEEFDEETWAHHEELASQVMTDDLVITAEGGGSMKGVQSPHALYPGFDPSRPATAVIIEPRHHPYLTLNAIGGTDLFQMEEPMLTVRGFRDGQQVVAQSVGPLWSDASKTGVVAVLTGFEKVERVEIRSDEAAPVSDVHFFLESLAYEVMDGAAVTPSPSDNNPITKFKLPRSTGNGGAFSILLLGALLIVLRKRRRA